jgi:hypothetical protein
VLFIYKSLTCGQQYVLLLGLPQMEDMEIDVSLIEEPLQGLPIAQKYAYVGGKTSNATALECKVVLMGWGSFFPMQDLGSF